jgi:hypothetical protein
MEDSRDSSLESALRKGLNETEGLGMGARAADGKIREYLGQTLKDMLVHEYRRRFDKYEDEAAIRRWVALTVNESSLDAQTIYLLFELRMRSKMDEFWKELDLADDKMTGLVKLGGTGVGPVRSESRVPSFDKASWAKSGRRFHCDEGCDFVGDDLYLAHRDRGHHPIPL